MNRQNAVRAWQGVARLRRALRLVWESSRAWTLASFALVVVQAFLPLLSLYLMKLIVDAVAAGLASGDREGMFTRVTFLIVLEGALALLGALTRSVAGLVSEAQGMVVTDRVQEVIHAKSVEADLEYYENPQYYDTLHRAQQEAGYRPTHILGGLLGVGQSSISLLAMVGLLIAVHWAVALMLFLTAIPTVLARLRFSTKLYRWQRSRTPAERMAWYLNWLLTRDVHAKEIRLFGLGEMLRQRYRDMRRQLRSERLDLSRQRTIIETGAQAVAMVGVFGAYIVIAYRTLQGIGTIGDLVMYYQAFQRGQAFMRDLLGSIAGLYEDSLFLNNLYEFLDLSKKIVEPAAPRPLPRPMRSGIAVEGVGFRYPNSTRSVLDDISLTIAPGEVIALVGENGAGKTTLCKLLCRLYDPDAGRITLDGTDLREFATSDLRRQISVIFQDYVRYNLSARDNIWMGNIEISPNDERIGEAARSAGADAVIRRLPRGYDTTLGKWFDEGEELSIGEWQKVALARAFLRDAQVIVLDEPTSSMDAKTEFEVFSQFRRLVAGRAAVLISHRFSTVRMADTIYVLEGGRIIERGSHADLVRQGGTYARLFDLQAQHYR